MTALSTLAMAWQFVAPRTFAPGVDDWRLVRDVQQQANSLRTTADAQMRQEADELRNWVAEGEPTDSPTILQPALALVVEAVRRVLGLELYDVQVLAGLTLARGQVAEMATGEGKTLAAALPAFVGSLSGAGVHVVTPNAYLARRDCELLAPVYRLLGAWAVLLPEQASNEEKRTAYAADITYGTGYEFGFDYLRDQLTLREAQHQPLGQRQRALLRGEQPSSPLPLQRGHALAIVDEIDSVLIDEASLPLILSTAPPEAASDAAVYLAARDVAHQLVCDRDYVCDPRERSLHLTPAGQQRVQAHSPNTGAWQRPWRDYVQQALTAERLFNRDADYVVRDSKLCVVDQHTGRVFAERTWREGLHQALEAKERLTISAEIQTAARIARQRYFRFYDRLCGMTGTTAGSEREFWQTYRLSIVTIPRRLSCQREEWPTRYFATSAARQRAIIAELRRLHASGRPVLVGTRTIEASETLARQLADLGVPHCVLNGMQTADEATIVAQAGQRGAITIATNMAGRGTDIRLGTGVAALGGLHVLATERHTNRRVDDQLAGRSGRQGEPGSCQFFVAADDALIAQHAPALAASLVALADGVGEIHAPFDAEIAAAQQLAAEADRASRRSLAAHDDWLDEFLSR